MRVSRGVTMGDLTASSFRSFFGCLFYLALTTIPHIYADDQDSLAPVIIENPLDVIVAKGEPATLNCAAQGPDIQFTWYKDGKLVKTTNDDNHSHRLVLQYGALFLLKVNGGKNDSDAGTYYCVAENKHGKARSTEASLKIALLLDDFKSRPRTTQAVLGHRAMLECSPPYGFPAPVVTWRKGEQDFPVPESGRITLHPEGNLIISNVERSDAGFYQCVATNMVGEKVSNPARLSVYEKPYFLSEPKDLIVEAGHVASFDCRVGGDPLPSVAWKKRNQAMPVGRAYITKDQNGLNIEKVEISDEGEYICVAKNPAGSIEAAANLRVHELPQFVVKPSDISVEKGGTAKFDCEVKGHPPPARFWSREGHTELYYPGNNSPDGRIVISPAAGLVIKDVRASDAGFYTCSTLNVAGSNLAKAALKVVSKTLLASPPPVIVHGHSNQTLTVGASTILPCQAAVGRKPPQIDWLKNDKPLLLDDPELRIRFNQLATGSLQIAELKKSDTGIYTCRVRNEEGQTTWTASLLVEEHTNTDVTFSRMSDIATFPTAPGKPNIGNVSENAVVLEWAPPQKSGATMIIGYMLQYFSPEEGQTWYNVPDYVKGPHHRVKDLKPSQSYVFIVRAENMNGIGPPSEMSEVVYTKLARIDYESGMLSATVDLGVAGNRFISEQLVKLEDVKTINSTAVKLIWKRLRPEPLVQGYHIRWRAIPGASASNSTNTTRPNADSFIVNNLKPFTHYEFFVMPYYETITGMPSNSLEGKTDEAPPSEPPPHVLVRMMNLTTLRIQWQKPSQDRLNGNCVGFQVIILGDGAKYSRNISANERAASVTFFHLVPGMAYTVKVAARTKAGIGVYREMEPVIMNEETLLAHKLLMHGSSGSGAFMHILEKPWFVPVAAVVIWLILVAFIACIYWRWRNVRGKANARLGMPFIKINDGSVHMTARDAIWMDHSNFNSAQRSLLLNNAVSNSNCSAPPIYTQTPHQGDFYMDGQLSHGDYPINILNTMDRTQSPHHYHYASLAGNPIVPTFYGGNQIMDDPSPYATTTLVMNNRRKWLQDTRPPVLPSNPVPSGPPPRFLNNCSSNTINGRHSVNARSQPFVESKSQGFTRSESPPHTDISYVQSSDGTGGSSNGRGKLGTLGIGRRSPPRQTLMDFMPPPPPGAPPPEETLGLEHPRANALNYVASGDAVNRRVPRGNGLYDAVSETLLCENDNRCNHVSPLPLNRPNSRLRTGYRSNCNGRQEDDDSQRSSLMLDENGCSAFCSSSEADEENSEEEARVSSKDDGTNGTEHIQHRPLQPCMGVSASALSQSSYDGSAAKHSASRLKLPQRGV